MSLSGWIEGVRGRKREGEEKGSIALFGAKQEVARKSGQGVCENGGGWPREKNNQAERGSLVRRSWLLMVLGVGVGGCSEEAVTSECWGLFRAFHCLPAGGALGVLGTAAWCAT